MRLVLDAADESATLFPRKLNIILQWITFLLNQLNDPMLFFSLWTGGHHYINTKIQPKAKIQVLANESIPEIEEKKDSINRSLGYNATFKGDNPMLPTRGYAVKSSTSSFEPFDFNRRELGPQDVLIQILYCGICHSDIHQARNEWGGSLYPMVPGHEIVGKVVRVGAQVKKFKIEDSVGVGCLVNSCRTCGSCKEGEEQFCERHAVLTYNGTEMDLVTPTFGGYSTQMVVNEDFVLKVLPKLPLANVAPLLCAGITTYSPLRRFKVGKGQNVGVIGLGGLGHMGVKLAVSMGARVTVLSTSPAKEADARRLGAHDFVVTKNPKKLEPLTNQFHLLLDTVSAPHELDLYFNLLRRDGTLVLVGVPEKSFSVHASSLIRKRIRFTGSLIGGLRETQEMLDYCANHNITSDIEIIPIQKISEAYERTLKGDVRYRFVIDIATLR